MVLATTLAATPATEIFVGRDSTVRLLSAFVASAAHGGSAGVVLGDAGIGKTALLRQVSRTAPGQVRWLTGLEAEAVLPFAVAADLLVPFHERFDTLPAHQRHALEVALARSEGPPPPMLAVCAGALGVLSAAGEGAEPLVVVVDDLQWVDAESRQVLLYVARRLSAERVVMLLALRPDPGPDQPVHGLPVITLEGLSVAECTLLARRHGLEAAIGDIDEVVRSTGGNPHAVLETLAVRCARRERGPDDEHADVVVGRSVARAWRQVLRGFPSRTQRALFAVAVGGSAEPPSIPTTLMALDLDVADLAPAEELELVQVDRGRIEIRHPVLRQVVIDTAPLAVRLRTYQALADLAPASQRAWYLSLATAGPDEDAAAALTDAASDSRARGARGSAAVLGRRAADLTPDLATRASRLLVAADDALQSGRAEHAERWAAEALPMRADPGFRAAVIGVRGRALLWTGRTRDAADELIRGAESMEGHDPATAAGLLHDAVVALGMNGDVRRCRAVAVRAESLLPTPRTGPRGSAALATAFVLAGSHAEGRQRVDRAEELIGTLTPQDDPQVFSWLALACCWLEDLPRARRLVDIAVDRLRQQGNALIPLALAVRSEVGYRTGRWATSYADAVESQRWADEAGLTGTAAYSLMLGARIEAARGQRGLCEEHVERALQLAEPQGNGSVLTFAPAVLGLAALTAGEPDVAVTHLERAFARTESVGLVHPGVLPFVIDLVEAHLWCGHTDRADQLLRLLHERAAVDGSVYAEAGASRCRALRETDPALAAAEFTRARALHARVPMPFELARTLLCEGEVLRRARHMVDARVVLDEAHGIFGALGAQPWAERASRELAAAGARGRSPRPDAAGPDTLTAQELQIARLVATGRNNAEVAADLYLSRKTVEAHLTRAYRKLGVRSRVELARLLLAAEPPATSTRRIG